MKNLIISDWHHHNNDYFINYQLKLMDSIINYVKKNNIDSVIDCGDTLDKRRIADIKLLNLFRDKHRELLDCVDRYVVIRGNHDTYYKTSGTVNSLKIIYTDDRYTLVDTDPLKIGNLCFIPWIDSNNREMITKFVSENNNKNNYLFSHLSLSGFDIPVSDQLYKSDYQNYQKVFSGHFHNRAERDNVLYVGNPYQKSFGELVKKGFHVFDDESGQIEFVENKADIFKIITINEDSNIDECVKGIKNRIIKVKINSIDKSFINECINKINDLEPHKSTITTSSVDIDDIELKTDLSEDKIIDNYLESIQFDEDNEKEIFKKIFLKTLEKIKES